MTQEKTEIKIAPKRNISEVFKDYQQRLKNFIAKRVDSKEDREDILQNVFYQLVKADSLMKPIDELTAWLYQVTRNQIIDWSRKRKESEIPYITDNESGEISFIETTQALLKNSSSPEIEYIRSLVWVELDSALKELPDEQSNVFRLTELDGLSFKEISESTGIPVNTLISRKRYAVLHLRERLKDLYEDIIDL